MPQNINKMNYAIIAAGNGERLCQDGIKTPKPLVKITNIPLIERLIKIFINNDLESLSIIINEEMIEVKEFIDSLHLKIPVNLVVKSTPSSMHSFRELKHFLAEKKFCLTTVDTVFKEAEFAKYIQVFENDKTLDGLMAVTDYIDDEKPLYVTTNESLMITGFEDNVNESDKKYISGGIYCLNPNALNSLENCINQGMSKMRNYQRQLISDGFKLKAYPFSKIIDVDRVGDISKANIFLSKIESV